jgi:hypothetical protein
MSQSVICNYLTRDAATRRPPTTIAGPSNSSNKRDKGKAVVREIDPEVSIIPNPPATVSSPAPISDGNQDTQYCQMRKAPPKSRYSAQEFDIQSVRAPTLTKESRLQYSIEEGHDTASVIWQYGADLEHLHKGSSSDFGSMNVAISSRNTKQDFLLSMAIIPFSITLERLTICGLKRVGQLRSRGRSPRRVCPLLAIQSPTVTSTAMASSALL